MITIKLMEGLKHLKFENVLQYVALPRMEIESQNRNLVKEQDVATCRTKQEYDISKLLEGHLNPDGKGRSDIKFFFRFLHDKGVRHIIRVIVDDTLNPHSDLAIESALSGLKVDIWDWRKIDLCPETIVRAAPHVREVSLYWSGNNAVLRGWSEPNGLKRLKELKKVYLHVEQVCLLLVCCLLGSKGR